MCKYCNETLYRTTYEYTDDEAMFKSIDKKFCAECGTPLGEVKPLTVEQLRQMDGKPVYVVFGLHLDCPNSYMWAIAEIIPDSKVLRFYEIRSNFRSADFEDYGIKWVCYDREPKGEAE